MGADYLPKWAYTASETSLREEEREQWRACLEACDKALASMDGDGDTVDTALLGLRVLLKGRRMRAAKVLRASGEAVPPMPGMAVMAAPVASEAPQQAPEGRGAVEQTSASEPEEPGYVCPGCNVPKRRNVEHFRRDSRARDGFRAKCLQCEDAIVKAGWERRARAGALKPSPAQEPVSGVADTEAAGEPPKACRVCGEEKPHTVEHFRANPQGVVGTVCRRCMRAKISAGRQRGLAAARAAASADPVFEVTPNERREVEEMDTLPPAEDLFVPSAAGSTFCPGEDPRENGPALPATEVLPPEDPRSWWVCDMDLADMDLALHNARAESERLRRKVDDLAWAALCRRARPNWAAWAAPAMLAAAAAGLAAWGARRARL